ncbi:MAG: hypothetical protein NTU83_09295, partial [Candidatus Hydrogenedentes bacterium]|nr:hypothetical protein [Candidatus Hydrogenedentota bacterium]
MKPGFRNRVSRVGTPTVSGPMFLLACAAIFAVNAWAQERVPHIGYLYPAGGQQGTVMQTLAAGQFMRGANNAYVSGEGVHATVMQYAGPLTNDQIRDVRQQINMLIRKRRAGLDAELLGLPEHPLLRNIEKMDLRELEHWQKAYFDRDKRPMNPQLSEMVLLEVTIDANAPPGDRELRLGTANGLTNPLRFQVQAAPELCEREPNDLDASEMGTVDAPVVLNGQIIAGDVDRFRFRARKGQHIVIEAFARALMPYLPDAVPGWFQPVLTLYDAQGKELA